MKDIMTTNHFNIIFSLRGLLWSVGSFCIVALLLVPLITLFFLSFRPSDAIWAHLIDTVLGRYVSNSLTIGLGTGILTAIFGTISAWLVTFYRFPLSYILRWALLLPLAVPAYIAAYALVDFFEYAGFFQTTLRQIFGWESPSDYMFPEIRSRNMAIVTLSSVLYPYVFLLMRAALKEQAACSYDVARALGKGPLSVFFRVGIPICRPAIAAGVGIAMMEAISDFGVVDYFAVQTLTTGIFTLWLEKNNISGAAQLSGLILISIFLIILTERLIRNKNRYFSLSRHMRPIIPHKLTIGWGIAAMIFCLIPLSLGFILPVGIMSFHTITLSNNAYQPELWQATLTTAIFGTIAAFLCVLLSVFMLAGFTNRNTLTARFTIALTSLGYATPGVVLAVGLLIPISFLDHKIADIIVAWSGYEPGLLITGSGCAVILAYIMRFFAIPLNAADSALERISPSFFAIGRVLGKTRLGVLTHIHLPMIRGSLIITLLLVFVDTVKELPATLLLRPFGMDTLAIRTYESASLENIEAASRPSLIIVGIGMITVFLLLHRSK